MIEIFSATKDDIPTLIKLRFDFLESEYGQISHNDKQAFEQQMFTYFDEHLESGYFHASVAKLGSEIVSVAFLVIYDMPAAPAFPSGRAGTILNVLTYPAFQRQGYATKVMEHLFAFAKKRNVSSLRLNATAKGEALYESMGFEHTSHPAMTLSL